MAAGDRSDTTRMKILEGAERLFSEKGVDGASMDELAKTAGVNKALLFYHFGSKSGLLTRLCEYHLRDAKDLVSEVLEGEGDPRTLLDAFIDRIVAFIKGKKAIVGIMVSEALKRGDANKAIFELLDPVFRILLETARKKRFRTAYRAEDLVVAFFMKTAPLILHTVLGESFARFYGISEDKVDRVFSLAYRNDLAATYLPEGSS